MKVTVFTPTYNRKEKLKRVYTSLCRQTCKDFLWLIIDDGSMDNTEEEVKKWILEDIIHIKYIYEENHGKAYAHNKAVCECETEAFTCLDSDDFLVDNAVETIVNIWPLIAENKKIAGIIAPRKMKGTSLLSKKVPKYCKLEELYAKLGFKGETLIVFKTKVINDFQFPIFEGEKFISESVIYRKIDTLFSYYLYNDYLSCGDYLIDGLSSVGKRRELDNPLGTLERFKINSLYGRSTITKWKNAGCYFAWKDKCNILVSNDGLPIITRIAGKVLFGHYRKLMSK